MIFAFRAKITPKPDSADTNCPGSSPGAIIILPFQVFLSFSNFKWFIYLIFTNIMFEFILICFADDPDSDIYVLLKTAFPSDT
ncbi:MAG TPA: hypothetical protein DCQ58_00275 [Saprospirales bacterium]|nr:hypothetical protein [Saprospirales bacterium]